MARSPTCLSGGLDLAVCSRVRPALVHATVRVGLLTGGGDCPGLNAVVRAAVRKGGCTCGHETIGFVHGWIGVLEGTAMALDVERCRGILPGGGTILGTSQTNPDRIGGGPAQALDSLAHAGIDALVAIGDEDTLGVAHRLAAAGLGVVGVPATIENDVGGTEVTLGFDTAVQIASGAIDRLHTTAESHDRVMVVEVMGRRAGWIATNAGISGGAAEILIPEQRFDIVAVAERLVRRHEEGRYASIVVVAAGALPKDGATLTRQDIGQFGHARLGGIATLVAREVEERTGFETRVTVLGDVQRGGTPTAFDRVLATRFGIAAIDAVHDRAWDQMVALRAASIVRVPLAEALGATRTVDADLYNGVASPFFG